MIRCSNILIPSLVLLFSLLAIPAAQGVDHFANNGLSGDWDTTGHWSPTTVPGSTDRVYIGHGSGSNPATMTINSALGARSSEYMFIGGNSGAVSTGTLNVQNAQTLNTNGYLYMSHGSGASSGTLLVNGGSTMTATSGGYISDNANGQSTITVDGAGSILSVQGAGDATYFARGSSGARVTVHLTNGGTLNIGNQGAGGQRTLRMGSQSNNNSYATLNIGGTSMMNIGNNVAGQYGHMAIDGGDSGGMVTYDLPLALNPNTAGKIYLGGGIYNVAQGANNKVTVNISTTGAKPSEAVLDWHNDASFRIADGATSIGIVNLSGVTINNATYYSYIGAGSGSSGTLNMTNSIFTNSGTGDPLRLGGGGSGSVGTMDLKTNSTYTQTTSDMEIGGSGTTDSKGIILLDSTSKINLSAGGVYVRGRDNTFLGDIDTPAGVAGYTLPLANTANSGGKIYANRGLQFVAPNSDNKVEVTLKTTGGPGVASDSLINAGGNGRLRIADGSNTIGIVILDGVSLTGYYYSYVGNGSGSDGRLTIKNASFDNAGTGDPWNLGRSTGKSTVTFDNGTYTQTNDHIYNRRDSTASAQIQGKGTINRTTGTFFNDGRVAADGGLLTINAATISSQNYAIAQTSFGQAGWYATTGSGASKLTLPNITFASADRMWGDMVTDTPGDANPDLVNSVFFDVTGTVTGSLAGSLLATDHSSLPTGLVNPIGAWDFSGLAFGGGSLQMTIRYDDLHTNLTFGESNLKMWHYVSGSWQNITGSVDTGNNRITSIAGINSLSPFALAEALAVADVPEPSTYALGLVGLAGLGIVALRKKFRRG